MNRQGREVNLERKVDVVEDLDARKQYLFMIFCLKGNEQ